MGDIVIYQLLTADLLADAPPRQRDTQKSKVYMAEADAFGLWYRQKPDFTTLDECKAYIDAVLDRKRVQARYPKAKTHRDRLWLRPGHGARHAFHRADGSITLPRGCRQKYVILHELAHWLTPRTRHGWEFTECLLWLVRQVMGVETADKLEAAYRAHKVRYRKPRPKRTLSPEQKAAAVERLDAARRVKAERAAAKAPS